MTPKCLCGLIACGLLLAVCTVMSEAKQPNIVVVMADDLDLLLNSTTPEFMPLTYSSIVNKGLTLGNFFSNSPECCPARADYLMGQIAKDHNITGNFLPYGGYQKFAFYGYDKNHLGVWLQELGYNTYFVGKLLNYFMLDENVHWPQGWTEAHVLYGDRQIYNYTNPTFSENGSPPITYSVYSTELIAQKGIEMIRNATQLGKPFYMQLCPVAPHTDANGSPPPASPKYANLYAGRQMPVNPSYNSSNSGKQRILTVLPPIDQVTSTFYDTAWLQRVRALRSIDDLVGDVVYTLDQLGVLDNTYVIFLSDNGYHIGNFRLPPNKRFPYSTDTHVPFFVRGPGIKPGSVDNNLYAMIDLTATVMALAGGSPSSHLHLEGTPMPWGAKSYVSLKDKTPRPRTAAPIMMWQESAIYIPFSLSFFALQACQPLIRARGSPHCYKYIVWCNGFRELYNLTSDPWELTNLYPLANASISGNVSVVSPELTRLLPRLNALISIYAGCTGMYCRDPILAIPMDGRVVTKQMKAPLTLKDLSAPALDPVFAALPPLVINKCATVYNKDDMTSWYTSPQDLSWAATANTSAMDAIIATYTTKQVQNTTTGGARGAARLQLINVLNAAINSNSQDVISRFVSQYFSDKNNDVNV